VRLDHPSLLETIAAHGHLFLRLAFDFAGGLAGGLRFWFWFWFGLLPAIFHLDVGCWR